MPGPDYRYFAIFGAMRTGSNLLERSLGDLDGLTALGELFNEVFVGKPGGEPYLGVSLAERNRDPLGFLETVLRQTPGLPGFRIFPGHDARVIDHAARDPACAKIVLRRDPIDSYISLKIARETGQWMLTKPENRRLAKVRFEAEEFETYRDELAAHYRMIRRKMRAAGQSAFEIAYGELRDLELLNGVVAYLGLRERFDAPPQKIHRQNPPAWEDKVSNVDDLLTYMGARRQVAPQPSAPVRLAVMDKLVASRGFNLIYAPIPGAGADVTRRLIRDAEEAANVAKKPLATGLTDAHIARRRRRGGFAFAFIRHPALRVLDIFATRIAATGEGAFCAIQDVLAENYGAPLAAEMAESVRAREAGLDAFIAFIADNLAGRTSVREDLAWTPQTTLLADYAREAPLDFVGRSERAQEDGAYVLSRLGEISNRDKLARKFAKRMEKRDADGLLTPARERRIQEIYARDYARLGYSPLSDGG